MEAQWIIISSDGRHASLGSAEPAAEDVARVVATMERQGLVGFLCQLIGPYHSNSRPVTLRGVRGLAGAEPHQWSATAEAFDAARRVRYPHARVDPVWQARADMRTTIG